MDLIDYLQSYTKDSKGKPIMRKRKKTKGKQPTRPRRARGYGQRSSKYDSSNNSTFNNNMEKLLTTILAAVTKPTTPSVESLTQGKEFLPRDRQIYSQVGIGQKEFFGSIKQPVSQKSTQVTGFDIDRIEQQKALLYNTETDFDMRVENILDKQKELINHLGSVKVMYPEEATRVRKENLKLKEEILGQNLKIQELLNDAEDLNDFKSLVDKQNKMIEQTTNNFATIDNDLSRRQQEEIEKLKRATNVMGREFKGLVEKVGGRQEELETLKLELESEQQLTGELASKLKTFVDMTTESSSQIRELSAMNKELQEEKKSLQVDLLQEQEAYEEEIEEQKQLGILGVLGRDVLAGVRQDISKQQTLGTLQGIREEALSGVRENIAIRKGLGQEILSKKRKGFIDVLKGEKEDLNTLLEREEEASEIREDYMRQMEDELGEEREKIEKQQQAITRGLGREIIGKKKGFFKELELQTRIMEANEGAIQAKREHNSLLEKYAKAEQQKANSQAQLRGLKQYADSLNDQLLASGAKGLLSQQQYFEKKVADLENDLAMEKSFVEDMKLKLEKSEEKEQSLRQQLREFEDEVDRQASRELERVVSGLSDI